MSDLNIRWLVEALNDAGPRASALAVCLTYIFCGFAGLPGLRRAESVSLAMWLRAAPYAACWLASMFLLFAAIAMAGVVPAVIAQAARGLFSIGVGVIVARLGWIDLEPRVGRAIVWKRVAATLLMIAAIALYMTSMV